jgi:hypothetical protein
VLYKGKLNTVPKRGNGLWILQNGQYFEDGTGQYKKMHERVLAIITKFLVPIRTYVW